jgi:hypothetical protein
MSRRRHGVRRRTAGTRPVVRVGGALRSRELLNVAIIVVLQLPLHRKDPSVGTPSASAAGVISGWRLVLVAPSGRGALDVRAASVGQPISARTTSYAPSASFLISRETASSRRSSSAAVGASS